MESRRCRMGKLYRWLGLSCDVMTGRRRVALSKVAAAKVFAADILFVTGAELVFTQLSDATWPCRTPEDQVGALTGRPA